jgi:hypothetical protein
MSASQENNRFYGDEDRYIDYIGKAVEKALNEVRGVSGVDLETLANLINQRHRRLRSQK